MIEYFRDVHRFVACNAGGYKIALEGIRRLLLIAGYEYMPISQLKSVIKGMSNRIEINQKIIGIQDSDLNDSHAWGDNIKDLLTVLGLLDMYAVLTDFISYVVPSAVADEQSVSANTYVEKVDGSDICIEFDTIYSVKGETHAATLYLKLNSMNMMYTRCWIILSVQRKQRQQE